MLTRALMQKAMQGETDPKQLEFYVTVEYFSHKKHATDNVNVNNLLHTPVPTPQPKPQQPTSDPSPPPQSIPENPSNNTQPRAENSPAAEKPASQMEERGVAGQNPNPSEGELHDYQETQGTIEAEQPSTPQANEGKTVSIVQDSSVEELLDAYFAKKEYTKHTGEAAGTLEYQFGSNGNKTATDAEKEKIAKIIFGKPAVKGLTDKKEYTTLEAIKQALSKEVYNKDEKVSFQTFKLGAELKKITSAPLDTKLYLVAKTAGSGLSDKQATIIIKEKDGLIKGSAGAVLPILEISEEQMDQATPTTGEVPGTEKREFTGKIENGMVKIPVHLRPKSDDELKQWKEKISKGKEDGEYTYKFGGENKVTDENSKKRVAEAILKNSKNGNTNNEKIADGKTAYIDDIEKALEIKTYQKDQTIKFKLYKKEKELLYLQAKAKAKAKAKGEKQHDKEFLKADGVYFEVGNKCPRCEAEITLKLIEDLYGVHSRSTAFRVEVVKYLNQYIEQRKNTDKPIRIDTCLRKAHFFAQVGAETLGINTDWIVETDVMPYTPANVRNTAVFGDRSGKLDARHQVEIFCAERPQKKLLSFLYAQENGKGNGNGNEASGDGYVFRGRGLKQLTGRGNYKTASETLQEIFPDVYINLEANPDKVKEAKYAVLSALAYWQKHKIWEIADEIKISNEENIKRIRRTVNGGTAGWKDAKKYFEKGIEVFEVNNCSPTEKKSDGKWHDPVDNPKCTLYMQSGGGDEFGKHWGLFGKTRNGSEHHGLDLFANPGTHIYACVKCEVYDIKTDGNVPAGYGKQLFLKVLDKETFLNHYKEYTRLYPNLEYNHIGAFSKENDIVLHYAHLRKIYVKKGWVISNVDIPIGETGVSGVTKGGRRDGTAAPHLHFEIRNKDTKNRINPGFFIDFKNFSTMSEIEKNEQKNRAEGGKIFEFEGLTDIYKNETDYE